jgi:hypothetical protein
MANQGNAATTVCAATEPDLVLYYYGDLELDSRKAVEAHLSGCVGCRSYLDELGLVLPRTVEADDPPDAFWDNYRREMRHKLSEVTERKPWWQKIGSLLQPWPVPAIATAAVLGLALAVTFSTRFQQDSEPARENSALIEMLPVAENLEFFTNMDVLDSMDLLEQMGSEANGTS